MNIEILQLIEGAKQARGLSVIIDVFRAFSTACYAVDRGVRTIIPVGSLELAYRLKEQHPEYVLVGERGGVIQPGFDYGNSPTQMEGADLLNKVIVHTTSAGTQGIVHAKNADEVITGSFVNAAAIVKYIHMRKPDHVSLVCMGLGGVEEADEDTLCAQYIKGLLKGEPEDFEQIVEHLKHRSKSGSFLDVTGDASAPKEDFDKCLDLNRFNFVLKVERDRDMLTLKKMNI